MTNQLIQSIKLTAASKKLLAEATKRRSPPLNRIVPGGPPNFTGLPMKRSRRFGAHHPANLPKRRTTRL
jgi:hypothetical protein